jgi:AraC-like DNA-binding protein
MVAQRDPIREWRAQYARRWLNIDFKPLSVAAVAKSQGISPRYLHRLLDEAGTLFATRVNELRLREAFKLLNEPRESARRISDIALQVGFSDISHFNRLFRSRFGDTPSGVRGEGRRPPLPASTPS